MTLRTAKSDISAINTKEEWAVSLAAGAVVDVDADIPGGPAGVTYAHAFDPISRYFEEPVAVPDLVSPAAPSSVTVTRRRRAEPEGQE